MALAALTLGPVEFQEFEIPPSIRFGGRQRLAVHRLSTGQRVTDVLGADDMDIMFNGVLSGASASDRSQELDLLRNLGQILPLSWSKFSYSVVIREFAARYTSNWWIPYRITCSVILSPNNFTVIGLPSFVDLALASVEFMQSINTNSALSVPDIRPNILAYREAGRSAASSLAVVAMIQETTQSLANLTAVVGSGSAGITINPGRSPSGFTHQFNDILVAAENIQNITAMLDCLGEAEFFLRESAKI